MQIDPASAARQTNGKFLNRHQGGTPPSQVSIKHARWGDRHARLQLHNSPANLLTGALLFASLLPGRSLPGPVVAARRGADNVAAHATTQAALLPSAQACGRYAPVGGISQTAACRSLGAIGNGVIATCVAHPRRCAGALALGTLAATSALAYARVADGASVPESPPLRRPHATAQERPRQDAMQAMVHRATVLGLEGTHVPMEDALLQIARDCDGDRSCRAAAINALLQHVPRATLAQLRNMTALTAPTTEAPLQDASPLPGASAHPWNAASALQELADTLADLYTPAVAAFQDDMEAIVGATISAGNRRDGSAAEILQRWIDANARRQEAIATLLVRDAGPVNRLPYSLHGLAHLGIADGTEAFNLHVELAAAGTVPPTQRVLLVAHGDMIGRALGSEGAYDNASGVATLLHIARQWQRAPSNAGIQLELLVTSHEELGFLGARAYINDCLQHESCPTFVINVDMIGRGGHGYAISGTGDLAGTPHLGKPTMYLQAPPVSGTEQHARQQLEARLAARGFTAPAAADAPWITSDNIAFQNASIPCVGVTQVGAAAARQWKQLEAARNTWQQLDADMDWTRWQAQQDGSIQLSPDAVHALKQRYQAAATAYHAYRHLRDAHPNAPPSLIHGPGDRLHRVNPAMAVDFADALLDGLRHLQEQTDACTDVPAPVDP